MDGNAPVTADLLTQTGLFIFAVVLVATWVGGLADYGRLGKLPVEEQDVFRRETRRALPWAIVLLAAQVVFVLVMYLAGSFRMGLMVASNYAFVAVVLPFLWGSGRLEEYRQGLPVRGGQMSGAGKWSIVAALVVAGSVLSLVLFRWAGVRVGSSVAEVGKAGNMGAVALLALWLMFNAPWLEELVFRHYMLMKLGRWFRGGRWMQYALPILITSALFAVGHAGHMIPAWPKLVQTFTWGVALAYTRLCLGTGYAVALHTGFNVSALVVSALIPW